jgi:hypothetical protein
LLNDGLWQPSKKDVNQIKKEFEKTFKTMVRFCFVMTIIGFNTHNAGKKDDDD